VPLFVLIISAHKIHSRFFIKESIYEPRPLVRLLVLHRLPRIAAVGGQGGGVVLKWRQCLEGTFVNQVMSAI